MTPHPFTEEERREFDKTWKFGIDDNQKKANVKNFLISLHKKLIDVILREVGEVQQDFVNEVWNGKEDPNNVKYFIRLRTFLTNIKEEL